MITLRLLALFCASSSQPCFTADETPADAQTPVAADHAARMRAGTALFTESVRELLTTHCLRCHGGESVRGELDLSSRSRLLQSGYVDLNDAAGSHLVSVVSHAVEPRMPQDGEQLPPGKIRQIVRWIELGAPYDQPLIEESDDTESLTRASVTAADRQFWSFRPLVPVVPPATGSPWVQTPLDEFIVAAQQQAQIRPSPPADRRRLIRRAYFDLIGLPPDPAQVQAFLNDQDPAAWIRLIDRLLDSPHYGERWARHWLDIARFGESHGYEQDYDRPHAYHYRDFLIRALNQDMPYDSFVRLQVAGDELEPDSPDALMATGFLGAGVFPTQLTEKEFESSRYDELDDIVSTLGSAVLGLSIGCARCHAHKFDPVSSLDYYRMVANFTKTIRSEVEVETDAEGNRLRRRQHSEQLAAARAELHEYARQYLVTDVRVWLDQDAPAEDQDTPWELLDVQTFHSSAGTKWVQQADQSWLATGTTPQEETLLLSAAAPIDMLRALRIEVLCDDSLPQRGPGRADNGNFVLSELKLTLLNADGTAAQSVAFASARATHQQNAAGLSVLASIDGNHSTGWAVDAGGIGSDQAAVFDLAEPVQATTSQTLQMELVCAHPNGRHIPGRIRISAASAPEPVAAVGEPGWTQRLRLARHRLQAGFDETSADFVLARRWVQQQFPAYRDRRQRIADLERSGPEIRMTKVQVSSEGLPHLPHNADGRGFPHFYPQTWLLARGDVHQKRTPVSPGFLTVLMPSGSTEKAWHVPPPDGWQRTGFHRAALAHWLTDPRQGAGNLAARVIVNRIWLHHFGNGLVATPNDFGSQGDRPTHPELLDWLAVDLIQHGWKLKRLHRLIMQSAVYRQSGDAADDDAHVLADRENRLLWRFPPRRLEAEAIRDTLLAVSGELDPAMYGPGTLDQAMRRRSIYFTVKRSQLIPMMVLFDWPEHQVSIGQRSRTTVAPQALAFMNSPECRQYAASFARRVLAGIPEPGQTPTAVTTAAWQTAFGRDPLPQELAAAVDFLNDHPDGGKSLLPLPETAVIDLCQAVLSMNELIYVD